MSVLTLDEISTFDLHGFSEKCLMTLFVGCILSKGGNSVIMYAHTNCLLYCTRILEILGSLVDGIQMH